MSSRSSSQFASQPGKFGSKGRSVAIKTITEGLKEAANELGFVLSGVTAAAEPPRLHALHRWVQGGYAGQMQYIADRLEAYAHPNHVLDGCRSLLMLAYPYRTDEPENCPPGYARIARYAWGAVDYHDTLHDRLKRLKSWLEARVPGCRTRGIVDTAPLLEREFAELAGLGWVGKNTLLLNRRWGSYFFICAVLTDVELELDEPSKKGHCGTCTACLDACPTEAFVEPYVLDANRCLSYLTIEHRDTITQPIANQFHEWIFGCDVCQEVCPWNRKAAATHDDSFSPCENTNPIALVDVLQMDEAIFRDRFRKTPLWRTKRRGMIRNAILTSVAQKRLELLPQIRALAMDSDPLVRDSASWALSQLSPERTT